MNNIDAQNFKRWLALGALVILCAACTNASDDRPNHNGRPDLSGVWFWPWHAPGDSRWRLEDAICKGHCSKVGLEYLRALLNDPQNDDKSITALYDETLAYDWAYITNEVLTPSARAKLSEYDPQDDPAVDCNPDGDGWVHQIQAPIPFKIEQFDDGVVIRYTYWNAVRTIYTDGRKSAQDGIPTRLGYSIGWYEGETLVVETTGILPAITLIPSATPGSFITHGSEARTIERYTPREDGSRLDLEWIMIDPENFRQPLVVQASGMRSAETELEDFICEDITGEF